MTSPKQAVSTITGAQITLVQRTATTHNNIDRPVAISADYTDTPTQGNFLLLILYANSTGDEGTIEMPAGWTRDYKAVSTNAGNIQFAHKFAGATESTTVTVQMNADPNSSLGIISPSLLIAEYSGLAAIPFDLSTFQHSGESQVTSLSTGTLPETNQLVELIVAAIGIRGVQGALTSGHALDNSFTLRNTMQPTGQNPGELFWGDQAVAAVGEYETTGTWTTARRAMAAIVAYQANLTGLEVITSPGARQSLFINKGGLRNQAATETLVRLREGASGPVRFTAFLRRNGGHTLFSFGDKGWKLPENTALGVDISQATVEINVSEYYEGGS